MILCSDTIRELLAQKKLVIKDIEDSQIQPASVDLRLADEFLAVEEHSMATIDLSSEVHYKEIKADEIIVPPKSFILAKTKEYIEIPKGYSAFVEGRSSIGRIGLFIQNAGWVDPGFKGTITLELFNACSVPIKLTKNRRICQLVIAQMDKEPSVGYQGKYLGQIKTTGSKINDDTECR